GLLGIPVTALLGRNTRLKELFGPWAGAHAPLIWHPAVLLGVPALHRVQKMRASMSALAVTPVAPRATSLGSDSCHPEIRKQRSSPRMRVQVAAEMPLIRVVRYAVHSSGPTCTTHAAVRSVPRPARPAAPQTAASTAAHALITAREGRRASPRAASMIVSAPASRVTEQAGISAAQ